MMTLTKALPALLGLFMTACTGTELGENETGREASGSRATVMPAGCAEGTADHSGEQVMSLLSESSANLNAWSHISESTEGLARNISDYAVNLAPVAEGGCSQPVRNLLLVKKYHNWHQQHLSGLELHFPEPIAAGAISAVELLLRINSDKTHIPSKQTYYQAYGNRLTAEQLRALDNQQVTLELTLFDDNHADQSIPSLSVSWLLHLDPEVVGDQWLKVVVPLEQFDFHMQKDWVNSRAERGEVKVHKLVGIRINPETRSGKVVRHFLQDDYGPEVPTLYKEIGLSLGQVSIIPSP